MHMMHDAMQWKKKTTNYNWGNIPLGATDDTTNKGWCPRNPPTAMGEGRSPTIDSSCFKLISSTPLTRVLDTTNKRFLLGLMTTFFHPESSDDRTYQVKGSENVHPRITLKL